MKHFLKHKLLGVPLIIWVLQLLYVTAALGIGILIVLLTGLDNHSSHLLFQILFVLVTVIINIIWRVRIKKLKPEWF
jgi:hypothetical protein